MADRGRHSRRCRGKLKQVPLAAVRERVLDPGETPEDAAERALLRDALRKALLRLTPERHLVLALSMGLAGRDGSNQAGYHYTAEEIARILNVTRERVSAVRASALSRLRRGDDSRRLLVPFMEAQLPD